MIELTQAPVEETIKPIKTNRVEAIQNAIDSIIAKEKMLQYAANMHTELTNINLRIGRNSIGEVFVKASARVSVKIEAYSHINL
jgi:hypothetical protein